MERTRLYILAALALAFVLALIVKGPIPQDHGYHAFADNRSMGGIPNFWDVLSNLPFLILGLYGFGLAVKGWASRPDLVAKLIPLIFSLGVFLVGFGSAYYHWAPDNWTLVWDRLPMTLIFTAIFSLIVYDFIGRKEGAATFWFFVPFGIVSVFFWYWGETLGQGDLRPYVFVQFFPMLATPIILLLYRKSVSYVRYIVLILVWYSLAKVAEIYDHEILAVTGLWSGHSIKHLLSAVSIFCAFLVLKAWEREL